MAAESSRSEPSADSYIGCLLRLISNYGIRYEGIIYHINPEECSICLQNVRSFGSEGRKKDAPQVPPSERVFDYIIFRRTDIKDLRVLSLPPQTASIHNDPAIIQYHYSGMGSASTSGRGNVSDQSSRAVQLGHERSTFEGGLPLYQAGKNIEYMASTPPVANPSGFGMPAYWEGFYPPTSGLSHLPQTPLLSPPLGLSSPHSLPQRSQFSTPNSSFPSGAISLHEAASPLPPIVSSASTSVSTSVQNIDINSLFASTPTFSQYLFPTAPPASCTPNLISISLPAKVAPTHSSFFATEPSLNLQPNRSLVNSQPASAFGLNIPSMPPLGYNNTPGASVPENNTYIHGSPSNESTPSLPFQTISQHTPSSFSYFSSIPGESSLPLVTPGQLQHRSYSMLPSSLPAQTIFEDAKFKAQEPKIKFMTPTATSTKEPLFPSPKHPRYSMLPSSLLVETAHEDAKLKAEEPKIKSGSEPSRYEQPPPATSMKEPRKRFSLPVFSYSEDFDFMGMNEKFNKAEVWGHIGKGKTLLEYDERGQSSNANAIREEDVKFEILPAYSKDDFFDTLYSNSIEPGTHSGRARVSEQFQVDMEPSGDSQRNIDQTGEAASFRGGNRSRWHGRGDGSNTRGSGHRFSN